MEIRILVSGSQLLNKSIFDENGQEIK